jgi:hypothetical protein
MRNEVENKEEKRREERRGEWEVVASHGVPLFFA